MSTVANLKRPVMVLMITCALSLLGWALIHLFWEVPYRTFLWSEAWFSPIVEGVFGIPWREYATSSKAESATQSLIRAIGISLLLASLGAIAAWASGRSKRIHYALPIASITLFAVALSNFKESGFQLAMLIEHTAQVSAPLLLFLAIRNKVSERKLLTFVKLAIVGTFVGHGLYAVGYYPVPGTFIDMVISILNVQETEARSFLMFAGCMDFALCFALLFPSLERAALVYATVWGTATSLARPLSEISMGSPASDVLYWALECLSRAPHAGLPFVALMLIRRRPALAEPSAQESSTTTWFRSSSRSSWVPGK